MALYRRWLPDPMASPLGAVTGFLVLLSTAWRLLPSRRVPLAHGLTLAVLAAALASPHLHHYDLAVTAVLSWVLLPRLRGADGAWRPVPIALLAFHQLAFVAVDVFHLAAFLPLPTFALAAGWAWFMGERGMGEHGTGEREKGKGGSPRGSPP